MNDTVIMYIYSYAPRELCFRLGGPEIPLFDEIKIVIMQLYHVFDGSVLLDWTLWIIQ